MADAAKAIVDALYVEFLLRDLFAKIVPGSLVLFTFASISGVDYAAVSQQHGVVWVILVGTAWLIGFAAQSIGEATELIRHWPRRYADAAKRYRLRIWFQQNASPSDKKQVERYTIIQEATGNGATALLLSTGLWMLKWFATPGADAPLAFEQWLGWIAGAVAAFALTRMNRFHADKQYDYMDAVVNGLGYEYVDAVLTFRAAPPGSRIGEET